MNVCLFNGIFRFGLLGSEDRGRVFEYLLRVDGPTANYMFALKCTNVLYFGANPMNKHSSSRPNKPNDQHCSSIFQLFVPSLTLYLESSIEYVDPEEEPEAAEGAPEKMEEKEEEEEEVPKKKVAKRGRPARGSKAAAKALGMFQTNFARV